MREEGAHRANLLKGTCWIRYNTYSLRKKRTKVLRPGLAFNVKLHMETVKWPGASIHSPRTARSPCSRIARRRPKHDVDRNKTRGPSISRPFFGPWSIPLRPKGPIASQRPLLPPVVSCVDAALPPAGKTGVARVGNGWHPPVGSRRVMHLRPTFEIGRRSYWRQSAGDRTE